MNAYGRSLYQRPSADRQTLTISELAERLNIPRATFYKLIEAGELRAMRSMHECSSMHSLQLHPSFFPRA